MTNTQNDIAELEKTALGLRRLALKIIFQAGSGHPGGSLSATDLMAALFFGGILSYDSKPTQRPKTRPIFIEQRPCFRDLLFCAC